MESIRQIIDLNKLESVIDIPKGFNYTKVEIIIFPVSDEEIKNQEKFNPEAFYGTSSIAEPSEAIREMREEWDRV